MLSDEVLPTKQACIVALLIGLVEAIRHARQQPLPLQLAAVVASFHLLTGCQPGAAMP